MGSRVGISQPLPAVESLGERYRQVRGQSLALARPLAVDDFQIQAAPEVSPPKWHLAHVTWFFETFVLQPHQQGYRVFHPAFAHLFNSYYETVGSAHPRPARAVLSRPTMEEVFAYRAHVDTAMERLLAAPPAAAAGEVAFRATLGLHHEQQHQELLLMDIKRNFAANPLRPAYAPRPAVASCPPAPALAWRSVPGGLHEIGHAGDGFAFDNETPRHRILLEDHRLASRLVTNGEYLAFVRAGGYEDSRLWLSDGIRTAREQRWGAPLYWEERDGEWHEMTLHGLLPLDPALPVCHVSFYEADAFARWAGARLPSEEELEVATAPLPIAGNFLETGLDHPRAAQGAEDGQWFGDLWEWTQSPYRPYPGFRALPGSLGEYNAKFMANQFVLRGGCCATPRSHLRVTYRNFFYPQDRWPFTGIRLAADGA